MTNSRSIDLLTVAAIAAVAYVVTTLAHEGLGHGGVCLAVGAKPVAWGAYYFDCNTQSLPDWTMRAVAAAGNTVNLVLGGFFLGLLAADVAASRRHGGWTFFPWLMATINLYTWAGYFFFSGVAGIGDWGTGAEGVLYNLPYAVPARIVMAIGGMGVYVLLARVSASYLGRLTGGDLPAARRLSWTAYGAGGVIALVIGLMNPVGIVIVLISSLASSLGGTSGLFWAVRMMPGRSAAVDFELRRNALWIVAGIAAVGAYAAALGRSINF